MSTVVQRFKAARQARATQASRKDRGLTVYETSGPTTVSHSVKDWANSPRKRDRRTRPGGKLPVGTSRAIRRERRDARIASRG